MRSSSTVILFCVFLLGGVNLLAAQPVADLVPPAEVETRIASSAASEAGAAVQVDRASVAWPVGWSAARPFAFSNTKTWSSRPVTRSPQPPLEMRDRRPTPDGWVSRSLLFLTPPGGALSRAGNPLGSRRLNRKLLPIPLVRWSRPGLLLTNRGSLAISPALVIGRRLSFLPDIFPGGRTFGIAVEMKIRLDQRRPDPAAAAQPLPGPAFLSKVRALVNR